MRDPHVVALRYRLVPGETVAFADPPPVEWETTLFRLHLAEGIARVELKDHYASAEEARAHVDPFLRAWEVDAALRDEPTKVRFVFDTVEVIDRDPPPPRTDQVIQVACSDAVILSEAPTVHITRAQYPGPPERFRVSVDVETMWTRYEGYRAGREPLAGMAYMCLTVFEAMAGGRSAAAQRFGIAGQVLRTLGRLATEVGDLSTVRKISPKHQCRPHTGAEIRWVETAVKALIRRAAEWAADPKGPLPKLTMADLPPLS